MQKLELTPTPIPQHPAPPDTLPAVGAELWRAIVREYAIGHFSAANLVLLETFCRAKALVDQCDRRISKEGLFQRGKVHPAVAVRALGWTEMRHCATKLRLGISGTQRADKASVRPDPSHALRKPWQA